MSPSFHALHRPGDPLVLPNAWDHSSAAAFAAAGFAAIGTTSLGVAAAAGITDGTGASRQQTIALATALAARGFTISADIEGGFSDDPDAVADLCAQLADAGIAGVNLEDGRADGSLRPADQHARIIHEAKHAAPGLFINARTDTAWLRAGDLNETLERVASYEHAGADGVFVPGLTDPTDIQRLLAAARVPVNALLAPGRLSVSDLAALGVARVSCGSLLFRIALGAATHALQTIASGKPVATGRAPSYEDVQSLAESTGD
jgi:2-methylisocitrate lyase-like PEP mutase family enzyme